MEDSTASDDTVAADSDGPARASGVLVQGTMVGRYMVLSRIGAGGMGVVYAAYDPELDRRVALKLLHADNPGEVDLEARQRLHREAQALAKLGHPNVVAVHDVLEHDGRVVLAMEFVEGTTLGAWRRAMPRSWREILDVFVAAAQGLIAAHDRGLVHRDFKPDNVMITASVSGEPRVRVMDFGLARPIGELERVDAVVGTPAYMAPEQLAGRDVGRAADQFAFCVALWEALYGERPFRGAGLPELARAIASGEHSEPPPGARVPRWLHRACERGIAADPAQRFEDMHALVRVLQSGHRRQRVRVVAIGVALVVLVGLGVAVARQQARARGIAACERDGESIAEVWNDSTRAAMRDGLLQSGAMSAATTVEKVTPWLDDHARAWARARTDACLAHALEQRWSDHLHDRALWCLDERKLELQALVARLADADSEAANRAVAAATNLRRIEPCLDEASLMRRSSPPPEARDEIPAIYAELARADALWATGAFDDGLAAARASLARARELGWPRSIASAQLRVATLLAETGNYADAETDAQAAYFTAISAGEIDEALDAADVLANLVGTSRARPDDGIVWSKHADVLRAAIPDPLGLREAYGLDNVARIELARGHYEAAQHGLELALDRLERALGSEHPQVAGCLTTLGLSRFRRGDYSNARADFQRALAIVEATKGSEHRDVVAIINNLALVEVRTGKYAEASAHFERALALQTAAFGPTHPKVAVMISNRGVVANFLGEYQEAIELHTRALEIREERLGADHPDVAVSLVNLGQAQLNLGHAEVALPLFERALAIQTRALGEEHPDLVNGLVNLATLLRQRGDDDAAEPLLVRALGILERALGPENAEVAYPLIGLANVAIDRGRGAEAVVFAERALALREHAEVPPEELAIARVVTARALILVDVHSDRARRLAGEACAMLRGGGRATRIYLDDCDAFERALAGPEG